jgi:tellurite resistance protein
MMLLIACNTGINRKQEVKKDKKTRVVDYAIFEFELPQDTSKEATEVTILNVELLADDLDVGKVKVFQIITQQKMEGEEDNILDVTQRDVKIGNYKLNCIELY